MSTSAMDAALGVMLVFAGIPAAWVLIWAFVKWVNRRLGE